MKYKKAHIPPITNVPLPGTPSRAEASPAIIKIIKLINNLFIKLLDYKVANNCKRVGIGKRHLLKICDSPTKIGRLDR